jgi:hypothetical protein
MSLRPRGFQSVLAVGGDFPGRDMSELSWHEITDPLGHPDCWVEDAKGLDAGLRQIPHYLCSYKLIASPLTPKVGTTWTRLAVATQAPTSVLMA